MPVRFRTAPMRYHQQDTLDTCGETVAQMILAHLTNVILDQSALSGAVGPIGTPRTHPDDLCRLLNVSVSGSDRGFRVRGDESRELAACRVFTALRSQCAVPTSVLGGTHWVAVTGAVYDTSNAADPDILGFFVHNPAPARSDGKLPDPGGGVVTPYPHHTANDTCGYGLSVYGSPDTFVTMHEWLTYYWSSPLSYGGQDVFVTIPRDNDVPSADGSVVRELTGAAPGAPTLADISALAMAGVDRYGLQSRDSLLGTKLAALTQVDDPFLTCHMDDPDDPRGSSERFYIVQMRGGNAGANIRIGSDGRFLSVEAPATGIPRPEHLFDFATAALERHARFGSPLSGLLADSRRLFTVHPALVWRPCRQSMSPFQPFVQINLAGTVVYATMSGEIVERLEPHDTAARDDAQS